MKKTLSLLLAAAMVLSLAACGTTPGGTSGATTPSTSTPAQPSTSAAPVKDPNKNPFVPDEPITLTLGVNGKANVTEWDNNKLVLWLEEQTGYNLEVRTYSTTSSERMTQVATQVAAKELLPDIMYYFAFSEDLRNQYGQDGYLLDVKPLFENDELMTWLENKYEFPYRQAVNEWCGAEIKNRLWTEGCDPEGHMYAFPSVGSAVTDQPRNMLYINQSWLDKLGLEMPNSPEELKTVLTAFVTQDPNGNGKADEMGMVGSVNIARGDIPAWLINNFIYLNDNDAFYFNATDDGELYLPYDRDEYREGLRYVNDLYESKLIDQLTWTIKESSELPPLFSPVDEVSKIGVFAGHISLRVTEDNPTLFEYEPLIPFEDAYSAVTPLSISWNCNLSADCKYPEAAFEVLFLLATGWGGCRERYGEENVDWEWVDPIPDCEVCGGKGNSWNGKSFHVIQDAYSGQTDSTFANNAVGIGWYRSTKSPETLSTPVDVTHQCEEPDDGVLEWAEKRKQLREDQAAGTLARAAQNNPENVVTKLIYTQDEIDKAHDARATIISYAKEARANFCTGIWDIDDDKVWEDYKKTMYDMGWDTVIECAQSAWDRMYG